MSIPTYVEGYPPNGSNLGNTKLQIRSNLDGTFQTVAVNHFNNNDPNAGQHMFIQFPNSSVAPPVPNGPNECDLYNGGSSIGGANNVFFLPPASATLADSIQMTRNQKPLDNVNGFSWLPGGFLLQWGFKAIPLGQDTVNFNTPMSAIYNVQTTTFGGGGNIPVVVRVLTVTPGSPGNFTYQVSTTPSTDGVTGFYWMAIGK